MVCLEIGTTCRGLIPKVETITWGLIPAGRDPSGCLICWAWMSSDFFDFAWFFNGAGVFQWCDFSGVFQWFWCISMALN